MHKRSGYDRLWNWFGMTYATWLTMPRVMMHAMPDDWQDRMAALCYEWDEAWNTSDMPNPKVSAVDHKGKFTRWPEWLLNYRHPDKHKIALIAQHIPDADSCYFCNGEIPFHCDGSGMIVCPHCRVDSGHILCIACDDRDDDGPGDEPGERAAA